MKPLSSRHQLIRHLLSGLWLLGGSALLIPQQASAAPKMATHSAKHRTILFSMY